jgi:hypothetical protein
VIFSLYLEFDDVVRLFKPFFYITMINRGPDTAGKGNVGVGQLFGTGPVSVRLCCFFFINFERPLIPIYFNEF